MKKALEKMHLVDEVKEEEEVVVVGDGTPKADAGRDERDVGQEEAYLAVVVDPLCAKKLANPSANGIMRFESTVHLFATFCFSAAVWGFFSDEIQLPTTKLWHSFPARVMATYS